MKPGCRNRYERGVWPGFRSRLQQPVPLGYRPVSDRGLAEEAEPFRTDRLMYLRTAGVGGGSVPGNPLPVENRY